MLGPTPEANRTDAPRPADVVAAEAGYRIADHLGRQARFNPTAALKALTTQLTQEYEDRFLVELIQNAYDAHPGDTADGQVTVRLDESADPAVLYVGNAGRPFTVENFDALTNVAQSSKPPGEGIGNKGVGFRSVLQVCASPEVFSTDPDDASSSGFGGFCFGFASDDDIRGLVGTDRDYDTVRKDFSRFLLPVPAAQDDPALKEMRADGMVTVVRLPLTSSKAVDLARTQTERLLDPELPIALFLERLARITVIRVDPDGHATRSDITRTVQNVRTDGPGGPLLRWVDTAGARFLTTTRRLAAADVRAVVAQAVERGELDESWGNWTSDVEVSLATDPTGPGVGDGRLYTYLPMRMSSPVRAHLHAPFHTKMARLDLNAGSLFNSFLLRAAAELAADTIAVLVADRTQLDVAARQAAAVDLLCWATPHVPQVAAALSAVGRDIATTPLLPTRTPQGPSWARIADARTWTEDDGPALNVGTIGGLADILEPTVGVARRERLSEVVRSALGGHLEPTDDELAGWVEKVALGMERAPLGRWNAFLNDVARVFEGRPVNALQGRTLLLDDKCRLRQAGPWKAGTGAAAGHPTVFVPPLTAGESPDDVELSEVPKSLQRAFSFLHKDIAVRVRSAGHWERTPVGELLRRGELVEQFELSAVLGHLERLLAGDVSDKTYSQALRWVYVQEAASRSRTADLHRLGLRVPTRDGWVPASKAVFPPGWGSPRAQTLAALLAQAGEDSATLSALRQHIIRPPADWPFKVRDVDTFRDFLTRVGVRDGLFPVPIRSANAIRMNGETFSARTIAGRFSLPLDPKWEEHVEENRTRSLAGPNTPYTGDQDLWVIPGQDAHASLSPSAKDKFAAALLDAAPHWPDEALFYHWRRRSPHHASKPDPQTWPSPARSFLERGEWFPMANPGRRHEHYYVQPGQGWTFDEDSNDSAPRFARLAPVEHRRRLSNAPELLNRLVGAGLAVWNSPASAARRLTELAARAAAGEIPGNDVLSVRRAATNAWSDMVRLGQPLPEGFRVLVAVRDNLDVADVADGGPAVFVVDGQPGLVAQVLETIGRPIVVASADDGPAIAGLLSSVSPTRVRRTSAVTAKVSLDGQPLTPGPDCGTPLLDLFGPWLSRLLLAVLDLRATRFTLITDRVLRDADARLRAARAAVGGRIDLAVDGAPLAAAGRLAQSVYLDDPDHPLVVVRNGTLPVPSWRALDVLADDLASLIGQGLAASEFRALALALDRSVGAWREPSTAEIAAVLRCDEDAVTALYRDLSSTAEHLRTLLAPFVAVQTGPSAAAAFQSGVGTDTDAVGAELAALTDKATADALLDAAGKSESVDGIRRRTGTPLGPLNDALHALGRPPLYFPEEHQAALEAHVTEHRQELLDGLRGRFAAAYRSRSGLDGYADARTFRLRPDPAWLHEHDVPDSGLLEQHVEAWLTAFGFPSPHTFPPVDEVRANNHQLLDTDLPGLSRTVQAWTDKHGQAVPAPWKDPTAVRDTLDGSGCLDFELLDRPALIGWLDALTLWPGGMDLTDDPALLGLTAADLERGSTSKAAADAERRTARTSLRFGDRTYDTGTDELREFVRAVDASLTDAQLAVKKTPAVLASFTAGTGTKNRPDGARAGHRHSRQVPTDEQTTAIGLAGELFAYRWLQRAYPGVVNPESWISGNRSLVLGGPPGDDTPGYDFKIVRRSGPLLFEVKATTTDGYAFEISDGELAAASAARKGQYRILYIRNVLSPDDRELLVLPSPLEPEARHLYRQINNGMRLAFAPASR
jgi:hypothetical protein